MWLFLALPLLRCSGVTEEENGAKFLRENPSFNNSEKWVAGGKRRHFQRYVWKMKVVCWNLYLEVGFFGPDFSILVQSCSFQVCVIIYCVASCFSTAYGSHERKSHLMEYLSARMNQREGLLAEGGTIPLSRRELGKSLSLWRERRACDGQS